MSAFEYQLARSARRKTLSIVIRHGEVKVMAPTLMPDYMIQDFIEDKTSWILRNLADQRSRQQDAEQAKKQYADGETFYYLGQPYPLMTTMGGRSQLDWRDGGFELQLSTRIKPDNRLKQCQKLMQQWYSEQLANYLDNKVAYYGGLMGVRPSSVKVKSYKRRWGSCTAQGHISFNYLLMMAPAHIIDYVIVHELAHLTYMNHSTHFWHRVARFYPDFADAKQWLKENASLLQV